MKNMTEIMKGKPVKGDKKFPKCTPAMRAKAVNAMAKSVAPVIDAMTDIAYFKDTDGRYLAVNKAFGKLARMPKARIIGKTDNDIFPADLAESCRESDWKVLKLKKPVRSEESVTKRGALIVYDTLKGPVSDPECGVLGIFGVSRDVSRYHQAEVDFKDIEERLGRVVADAPIVLYAVDANGIFILSEGQGLASLGIKPGEVVGKSVFDIYAHNKVIIDCIRHSLAGETLTREVEEGGRVFESHFAPHRGPDGNIAGMIGVAIDITDRVKAERERWSLLAREKELRADAERINRAKDDFLALLSHELRTPMTAMIGWTWLLRTKKLGSADHEMALDTLERNMKAQAQIIEDLLDISRIQSGKMRIESTRVEVRTILRSAVDLVMPSADARSISIALEDELPACEVSGDPERLQQAVWNLVSNAVKFTSEGGAVHLTLGRFDETVELTVKDTGMGIAPEYLPHVFDMFSQEEDAMTREHRGLGLGLTIAKHIIEMHGGTVYVHSEGVGQGAEFMVSLPLLADSGERVLEPVKRARRTQTRLETYPDLSGLHVLIVEDEPDTRFVLISSLEHCGARVTGASSAAEAFDIVRGERPDVLISDIMMPGEDGYSLMRRIRDLDDDEGGDIPSAALTGRAGDEDRTRALMAGFQLYVLKPVEPVELALVVESLSSKRKGSRKR